LAQVVAPAAGPAA